MRSWHALTIEVSEEEAEDVAALLLDDGADGAEVRDRSVAAMPGAALPPPGRAQVIAYYRERALADAAAARHGGHATVAPVPGQDWSETWKQGLAAFTVGRVFVRPSWIEADPPPGTFEVVLDPGMAFGTGTHPTTAMCLGALDSLLAGNPGADVLDLGTGSGLLAIAARKLGAARIVGTENDPAALRVAAENAVRNGVEIELHLEDPVAIPGVFGIVVANILANTLVELASGIAARVAPGGTLILSGLVAGQEDEVRAAYVREGLQPRPALDRGEEEWRLVALGRDPGRRP